jgi:hypothetical protein
METEARRHSNGEPGERPRPGADDRVIIPLVDAQAAERIYDPSLLHWSLWSAVAGALLLGVLGYALAAGLWTAEGLGQWAASGATVGAFTGTGIGAAAGALGGGLVALYRLPRRTIDRN